MRQLSCLFLVLAATLTSCVSAKKYNDMTANRDRLLAEMNSLKNLEKEKTQLDKDMTVLDNQAQKLRRELEEKTFELERLKKDNAGILQDYEDKERENDWLLRNHSGEKMELEEELATRSDEVYQRERELLNLEHQVDVQSYDLESLRTDLGSREQRVAELERRLKEKDSQMELLRTSLDSSLRGFSAADLSVEERNGKIYVTLSQRLLFAPGSDKVDALGEDALLQLAKALASNPGIEAVVEGHTDNAGGVDYNWDLSARRAASVVKFLAINGVSPDRLTAAGRGMHHPVAPNDSPENKAKNRRTEIILSPNLDKLYDLSK